MEVAAVITASRKPVGEICCLVLLFYGEVGV